MNKHLTEEDIKNYYGDNKLTKDVRLEINVLPDGRGYRITVIDPTGKFNPYVFPEGWVLNLGSLAVLMSVR